MVRRISILKRALALSGLVVLLPLLSSQSMSQEITKKEIVASEKAELTSLYEPREYVGSNKIPLKYRLLKPLNYRPGKKYPLVLFLHGAGERGDDNLVTLKHGAKDFADAKRREDFPCYVVVPQCPKEQKWSNVDWSKESSDHPASASDSLQTTKELLDDMVENAGIDKNRIYITGLSMGGYGTWDAITRYEGFFAAAAPICGGGDPKRVSTFRRLPIWCFHGDEDKSVKVIRSREMVDALKAVGSPIKYTEYPGVGHDSWTATYSNPDFYQWLFAQQKTDNQ